MVDPYSVMAGLGWVGLGLMAAFWIGVIALLVWGFSPAFPVRTPPGEPDALDIVQRRYARGEISYAEFIQARAALIKSK